MSIEETRAPRLLLVRLPSTLEYHAAIFFFRLPFSTTTTKTLLYSLVDLVYIYIIRAHSIRFFWKEKKKKEIFISFFHISSIEFAALGGEKDKMAQKQKTIFTFTIPTGLPLFFKLFLVNKAISSEIVDNSLASAGVCSSSGRKSPANLLENQVRLATSKDGHLFVFYDREIHLFILFFWEIRNGGTKVLSYSRTPLWAIVIMLFAAAVAAARDEWNVICGTWKQR